MDRQQAKDRIAAFRYEIKRSREAAKIMRRERAAERAKPGLGATDQIKCLKLLIAINERMAMVRDRERAIAEMKVYL